MDVYVTGSNEFRFEADGDFHADGDVYAFSTTVSSDENLKKDITIVSDAVTKVEALKGVTFKWKKNDADSAGVIAQDVEKVLPEVVKTVNDMEGNEFKAVNYAGLTSILIEAVKDLSARIKVLEAEIMPLVGSGQISLGAIATNCGGGAPHALSEYYGKGNTKP